MNMKGPLEMNWNKKVVAMELNMKGLADLIVIASLIFLLSMPMALAGEAQAPKSRKIQEQPFVPATGTPGPAKRISQAPEVHKTRTSIDFLNENSTLSQGSFVGTAPAVAVPEPPRVNDPGTSPVTLQVLQGTVLNEAEDVAMLVSEQCSQNGGAGDGTSSCERVYSNGHHATVLTQNANEGDELKSQTIIEEFDGDDTLLFRKTIRHRVDYNYLKDQKAREKEFFDIIYQPAGKKTTRELMVYEYFLNTGKTKSLSWTQYQQIGNEPKAGLAYHALLRYGDDGSPERGVAEGWDQGKKIETFMNWSRRSKGFATFDEETWGQWEGWIRNVSMQAYLP
jgi:hypothetical protein